MIDEEKNDFNYYKKMAFNEDLLREFNSEISEDDLVILLEGFRVY